MRLSIVIQNLIDLLVESMDIKSVALCAGGIAAIFGRFAHIVPDFGLYGWSMIVLCAYVMLCVAIHVVNDAIRLVEEWLAERQAASF